MGHKKDEAGMYNLGGHKYSMIRGARSQVMHGTAYKTSGSLKKTDLMYNKNGRIVSKRKHATAKREKRLEKAGYFTKKGKFGSVFVEGKSKRSTTRRKSRRS